MGWLAEPWVPLFIAVVALLAAAIAIFSSSRAARSPSKRVSSGIRSGPLNSVVAARIVEAHERVTKARSKLAELRSLLTAAQTEAAAAQPPKPELNEKLQHATREVDEAQSIVTFEEVQLDRLLRSGRSVLDQINWGTVLQYGIFASLALFVLIHLMSGITSSPPPGTTPRSMITLLISVVTVGIALILVLATIVSDSDDRERRFSQGKEVLTALLGVLGTIVGFYFGTSQDQAKELKFDPLVISMDGETPSRLSTAVHGGKPTYFFEATFTPPIIATVKDKATEDRITIPIKVDKPPDQDVDVSVLITVTDSGGDKGNVEYKQAIHLKAAPKQME
jgi:hypothetical protein